MGRAAGQHGSTTDNVAKVDEWDNGKKLQWLRVRLTGRAQTAVHRVTGRAVESFAETIKTLDQDEFQTRRKKSEGWAEYAEDLKTLADKGFPELQEAAKEQLALQNYLQQLDHRQVAFSVKQKRPETLDDAVAV